jgi:hypothetical protein
MNLVIVGGVNEPLVSLAIIHVKLTAFWEHRHINAKLRAGKVCYLTKPGGLGIKPSLIDFGLLNLT